MTTPSALTTQAPGFVRTLVPIALGPLLARFGFSAEDPTTLMYCSVIAGYGYYVVVRVMEHYFPTLGYLLGIAKQPVYAPGPSPAPSAGEEVVAVVVKEGGDPPSDEQPVQTDNTAKDLDDVLPAPSAAETFQGEMR